MPGGSRSRRLAGAVARAWRALGTEQRAAGVGAVLLAVSTLGPFSFVEAAILLVCAALLLLLKKRADGAAFHLPFGDGAVTAAAGVWCALLVVVRILDRPLGQGLLALLCAGVITVAGLGQRAHRPADDAATEPVVEPSPSAPGEAPTEPLAR